MNATLERAIDELRKLPEDAQEAFGRQLLAELEVEKGWDARFAASQDLLGALARRAREEVQRGDVFDHDPSDRPVR